VEDVGVGSWLAHGGQDDGGAAVVPGIPMSTTWRRGEDNALIDPDQLYLRDQSPLVRRVEDVVARLEGAAAACLFGSGMAAVAAVVRSVPAGGTLLLQDGSYWGTTAFVRDHCAHAGVTLVEVDTTDADAAAAAVDVHRPDLVLVEVPSNPLLGITDVAALAGVTHAHAGVLAVDATAATPLGMRPLALGADLSVHSATKELNGHSDVLAGVVSTTDTAAAAWVRVVGERARGGAVIGQVEAWLLLRGLRTLHLRHERAVANAAAVAEWLLAHPEVHRVLHPSLPEHPGAEVHARQASDAGALLSFRVRGGQQAALRVLSRLRLVARATSLGGTESLAEHRASVQDGVPDDLLRLSVGVEDLADLLADLEHALHP